MKVKKKQIYSSIVMALIVMTIILLYPIGDKLLTTIRTHAYHYKYSLLKELTALDTSTMPEAQAVPILMYHGVVDKTELGSNTEYEVFISQMEMLKQQGYKTISVKEYDLFRAGQFVLPPKPIIITFDDGRKDSFYTVDNVLKKLGFKATIFLATIKANEKDPFYLDWKELAKVQATGRWEIEAHGRNSHDEIIIDTNGALGNYLASRMFIHGKGLESITEYEQRVKDDYLNGIGDIKENLGIDPIYFAIPLNDYGCSEKSNYSGAYAFNYELTGNLFALAFSQAMKEGESAISSFYNYQDTDPYALKRLEVSNMSADNLLQTLEKFSPKPPILMFNNIEEKKALLKNTKLLYGKLRTDTGITLISNTETPSARVLFGDNYWKNYSLKVRLTRETGHSVSIIIYYVDEYNFISLNWGEQAIWLVEVINGKERQLASYYPWTGDKEVEIFLYAYNGMVGAYFDRIALIHKTPINLTRGAIGFSVWDLQGAQSTIRTMEVLDLD